MLLASQPLFACFAPPDTAVLDADGLVARGGAIVVAKAISQKAAGEDAKATKFELVETLWGKSEKSFSITLTPGEHEDIDFEGHSEKSFWDSVGGRASIEPDCEMSASFKVGEKYLLFLKQPYAFKSFEVIKSDSDQWLAKIRDLAKGKK